MKKEIFISSQRGEGGANHFSFKTTRFFKPIISGSLASLLLTHIYANDIIENGDIQGSVITGGNNYIFNQDSKIIGNITFTGGASKITAQNYNLTFEATGTDNQFLSHDPLSIQAKNITIGSQGKAFAFIADEAQNYGPGRVEIQATEKLTAYLSSIQGGTSWSSGGIQNKIIAKEAQITLGDMQIYGANTKNSNLIQIGDTVTQTGTLTLKAQSDGSTIKALTGKNTIEAVNLNLGEESKGFILSAIGSQFTGAIGSFNTIISMDKMNAYFKSIEASTEYNSDTKNEIIAGNESIITIGSMNTSGGGNKVLENNIKVKSGSIGALTLKAQSDGAIIKAEGGANTIEAVNLNLGEEGKGFTLSAMGTRYNRDSINTITSTGKMNAYFKTIQADAQNTGSTSVQNKITAGDGSNIAIDSMSAGRNGTNTIIFSGKGDINIGNMSAHGNTKNSITLEEGNINITGKMASDGGATHAISVTKGDIKVTGDIVVAHSTTTIKTDEGTLTLGSADAKIKIQAGGGGNAVTTITAPTLKGYISELYTNGNQNSTNTFTINADSATLVIDNIKTDKNQPNSNKGIFLNLEHADLTIGTISVDGSNRNDGSNTNIAYGGTAVVTGNISKTNGGTNNFTLKGSNTSLTLKGARSAITTLVAQDLGAILSLDASLNDNVVTTIDTITNGGNLTVNFAGIDAQKSTNLILDTATSQEIKTLSVASGINNTLTLNGANTMTIDDLVSVTQGKGLTFSLDNGTTLNLASGMSGEGESSIVVDSASGSKSATLKGGSIEVKNIKLSGNTSELTLNGNSVRVKNVNLSATTSKLTLKNTQTDISTLSTTTSTSNVLELDGSVNKVIATIQEIQGDNLKVLMGGDSHGAELNLNGGVIKSIEIKNMDIGHNIFNFKSGTTTITDAIDSNVVASTKGFTFNLDGGNLILGSAISAGNDNLGGEAEVHISAGTLSLKGETNAISKLQGKGGTIDLAVADSEGNPLTRAVQARSAKVLTVSKGYSGTTTFNLYVDPNSTDSHKADWIQLTEGNDITNSGTAIFTVTGNVDDILAVTYDPSGSNNVQLAEGMKAESVKALGGESLVGYDVIKAQVVQTNDGKVYLGQVQSQGVAPEIKDVARSALTVNYDLYLANFNSLNKRMGELRDNPNTQGVWARIFGGAMSNDFGAGSKTDYVTAQGGYDYALNAGENAKNYAGVTIAYGKSWTKSNTLDIQASSGASIALKDVNSSMVEVGIYNSYVADSGWYNDTILKFDYIMSTFSMTDNLSLESKTNNFAMVLSDEFGYRYKFGSEQSYYIDPQVEVALGYFNRSDFNREMLATNSTLQASQDSILTLRTRAGATLGKKFSVAKGFASLYVGAFYEYDYINGGSASALSKSGIANPLDSIQSNGRAMLNLGSNIGLTENARLYIDVEKSFGDKQRTFMQFNFGARYSF